MDHWKVLEDMHRKTAEAVQKHDSYLRKQELDQLMIRQALNIYFLEQQVNMMSALNGVYEPKENPPPFGSGLRSSDQGDNLT